ncbi:hypothetical protein [Salibacterium aidingense]|uniref:hypothetical protein n=1 Tax=Salibacterium aidingense TaxID=384933 RepID=UPI00040A2FB9|nr:hypothetical protein [Salibacterium aidingense]
MSTNYQGKKSVVKERAISLFCTKKGLILLCVLAALFTALGIFMGQKNQVKATWIWDLENLEENQEEAVSFLNNQGVNLVYLHIDLKNFNSDTFQSFIKRASDKNIEVYALGGDPNWALTKNQESLDTFVSTVKDYNRKAEVEEKFQGIHVDIEPYLLPEWKSDRENVVTQWINNLEHLKNQVKPGSELTISGDVPFWINQVKIPGKNKYVGDWMISTLDSITVMAYRDHTDGENGIKGIVSPLVEQAANRSKSVVIAVNVIETDEGSHTTFHDNSLSYMKHELNSLDNRFSGHPGYGGVAVHDYHYWKSNQNG